jgi:hypothetical protein
VHYDYPTGTNIVATAVFFFAWFPILIAGAYAWLHRSEIQRRLLFVSLSALLAWGASSAPGFLLMPVLVWINSAWPSLDRVDSVFAGVVRALAGPAQILTDFQFPISVGLLAATSFWAPAFLRGKLALPHIRGRV